MQATYKQSNAEVESLHVVCAFQETEDTATDYSTSFIENEADF